MNTNPTPDALAERLRSYAGTCTGLEPKRIMIAAADSLESLHAKPVVGERVEETGWLIEYGPSSPTAPRYWGGVRGWTYDHMEAVRFSRQVDAQSIAESMDDGVPGNYRLAEHAWASAALQSPPPVVSGEAKHDRGCNSHQDYPCDCATLTASPPVVAREAETFNGYSRATAERALARVHAWCAWSENEYAGEDTNPRMCSDDVRTALALVSTPVYGAGVRVEQALAAGSTDGRSANAAYVPVAALPPP